MTTRRPAVLSASQAAEVVLASSIGCDGGQNTNPRQEYVALLLGIASETVRATYLGGPEPTDNRVAFPCGVAMSNFYAAP